MINIKSVITNIQIRSLSLSSAVCSSRSSIHNITFQNGMPSFKYVAPFGCITRYPLFSGVSEIPYTPVMNDYDIDNKRVNKEGSRKHTN